MTRPERLSAGPAAQGLGGGARVATSVCQGFTMMKTGTLMSDMISLPM